MQREKNPRGNLQIIDAFTNETGLWFTQQTGQMNILADACR